MKNKIKIITAFSVGFVLALGIGVYAAVTYNAKEIAYKNKTVEQALDELYQGQQSNKLCRRATELHTETCEHSSETYSCSAAGYATGSKITYGNLGNSGTLSAGDAFDCDVNGDGIYDKDTERFYFVSYKYTGGTKDYETFDSNVASLIYYNNVSLDSNNKSVPDNTNKAIVAYNSSNRNYEGPTTAILNFPAKGQWKNVKASKRVILNELGGNVVKSTIKLPGNNSAGFDYSNYAARFLTTQELEKTCNMRVGNSLSGEIENCNYLMENTYYALVAPSTYGYWLETPWSSGNAHIWYVHTTERCIYAYQTNSAEYLGVRPVIDVPVSDIEI